MGKTHFKMFKKGKKWCYMAIAVLTVTLGALTTGQVVQADSGNVDNTALNIDQTIQVDETRNGENNQTSNANDGEETTATTAAAVAASGQEIKPEQMAETLQTSNLDTQTQQGWKNEDGSVYYYRNGSKLTGQQLLDGKNYYFNAQGQEQRNYFLTENNQTYYFQNDGTRLDNGFYNNWGHTYYFGDNGARWDNRFYNNWGHTYYFGNGGMRLDNGFYNNWGHTYYFGSDGARWDNRFYNNWGHTYYFGNGGMRLDNGFYNNWGHTYYFGSDGARWDNRFYNNWGHTYYFGNDGALVTNQFVQHNGQTYYALSNGVLNAPRYFSQFSPIYAPEGCSVASLAMLLSIKNEYFNLAYAYNHLPQYGGAYNTGAFRGIISPEALTNYAHNWDSNVRNITGSSLTDISRLVWAGHPVLYYGMSSFERAGQRNHAKVIVGENNGYFHVYDPCYWNQGQRAHTAGGNAYDWGADSWQSWGAVASEYIGRAITIY